MPNNSKLFGFDIPPFYIFSDVIMRALLGEADVSARRLWRLLILTAILAFDGSHQRAESISGSGMAIARPRSDNAAVFWEFVK